MADHCLVYPICPDDMDWNQYFSDGMRDKKTIDFLDVGCGYGGLLVELSPMFPDKRILGLEIRLKVSDYVMDRIKSLRLNVKSDGDPMLPYGNIACLRTNGMKYLPNFIYKNSLEKMFFLFPDPHFKKQKFKWRIISPQLLAEYSYVMKLGGRIYIATDVHDLFQWMTGHIDSFPLFVRLSKDDESSDPVVLKLFDSTEEGKKVTRCGGDKYIAVYERISDPFESHDTS